MMNLNMGKCKENLFEPKQVVIDAMRTGVGNALNMLKSYIHSLKQQQIASSALKVIEDKK